MTNQIREERRLHQYFWMTPNLVNYMDLSPYEFRLYCHMKCVAGEDGACWQSTETMARVCKMSTGQVSKCKKRLVEAGLIRIKKKPNPHGGKAFHEITIVDIWLENLTKYVASSPHEVASSHHEVASSPHEVASSHHEVASSPHEIKKTPVIRPQEEETPSSFSKSAKTANEKLAREIIATAEIDCNPDLHHCKWTDANFDRLAGCANDYGFDHTVKCVASTHAKWCATEREDGNGYYNPHSAGWLEERWLGERLRQPAAVQHVGGGVDF